MLVKAQQQQICRPCLHYRHQSVWVNAISKHRSQIGRNSLTLLHDVSQPIDVIGTSNILDGTLIALVLAFTASFLQQRRNNDDIAPSEASNRNATSPTTAVGDDDLLSVDDLLSSDTNVFDGDSWKEISRPENYIFYNKKSRRKESESIPGSSYNSEKIWVFFALSALFIPIFSVEFFFALSRQVICGGDTINQSDFSEFLCSPAISNIE